MNAHQRRKLVRKHKELIAQFRVVCRLHGKNPLLLWLHGDSESDYRLALAANAMKWWLKSDYWSNKK